MSTFPAVWCYVTAVRKNDVVQSTFPVVADNAEDITYDIIVNTPTNDSYTMQRFAPAGQRWYRRVRIDKVGWWFRGDVVGDRILADFAEYANSVECPT